MTFSTSLVDTSTPTNTDEGVDDAASAKGGSAKKAFTFSRGTVWMVFPEEISIIGGKAHHADWHEDERSDVDTDDTAHELYRPDLADPLPENDTESVRRFWVQNAIQIAKLNGVACTVEGRTRIRMGRLVNAERKRNGLEPKKIMATPANGDLVERMILANNLRKVTSDLQKIADAKALLSRGEEESKVAMILGYGNVQRLREVLNFDGATSEIKALVTDGTIALSAGVEAAKVADPTKQREVAATVRQEGRTGRVTVGRVRDITAAVAGQGTKSMPGKKDLKALRSVLTQEPGAFADGVRALLDHMLGNGTVDPRLVAFLAKIEQE